MDETDDRLGRDVGRSGLAGEDHGTRWHVPSWIGQERLIARDDMQSVQQLALVLVYTLDLDIEQARRVDGDAEIAPDALCKPELVRPLRGEHFAAQRRIEREQLQFGKAVEIEAPACTQARIEQRCQWRVG